MRKLADRFRRDHPAYKLEATDDGVMLTARSGQADEFSELARDLINNGGDDFVVLPTTDGHEGYDQVVLIPLD